MIFSKTRAVMQFTCWERRRLGGAGSVDYTECWRGKAQRCGTVVKNGENAVISEKNFKKSFKRIGVHNSSDLNEN